MNLTVWDVGGQSKIRSLWRHYFYGAHALIYVVDSADGDRIQEARQSLDDLLQEEELRDVVVLVLANKQDLPQAENTAQLADKLNLRAFRQKWYIQPCVATSAGDSGLYKGLDWLSETLHRRGVK